ncbi:hypothetical protein FB470_007108 [Amycolatopsis thermophila]|uniref:Uncharacterized protein n=1 Tax=Amycolatopsis thermophila TaxID=206084 RepID=A0ABU0F693_9PSEU|nr:hypothetical protein [Amycolatopsis thermophila]
MLRGEVEPDGLTWAQYRELKWIVTRGAPKRRRWWRR